MATNKNIYIEFTADFSNNKKGDVKEFSQDICSIFVNELKVAKYKEVKVTKEKKSKKEE
jgi:hypothetical protein